MRKAARWTLRILVALIGIVVVAAVAGLGYRGVQQHKLAKSLAISSSDGIDETHYVSIGGVEQWVWIRGQNRKNPVVLIVHGGPGGATTPIADRFLQFEREYTVVHWDQVGAGKTFARAQSFDPSISLERIVKDGIAVTEFLKKQLSVDRVILLGWSWGSLVAIEMVRARPDLFIAYVGTGQIVNMQKGEALAYANVLAEARRRNDRQAIKDLETIGPPPYDFQRKIGVERKWAAIYEGAGNVEMSLGKSLLFAPNFSLGDAQAYIAGMTASQNHFLGERMDGPMLKVDLTSEPTTFQIPIFIIDGALDNYTPTELAREYFATINAPQKDFAAIKDAGHLALITRGDEFLRLMNERVRPLIKS